MVAINFVENNRSKQALPWLWLAINGVLTLALFQLILGQRLLPLLAFHAFSLLRYQWLEYAIVTLATIIVIEHGGLDLSVIGTSRFKSIRTDRQGKTLQGKVHFPMIPVGDSGNLQVGEEIYALGYPDISFGQLLVTKGMVSGFYAESGVNWIASDVKISHGNSGGLIINDAGDEQGWVPGDTESVFLTTLCAQIPEAKR